MTLSRGEGETIQRQLTPAIDQILTDCITAGGPEYLRTALQAENRGEMNEELKSTIDTLVGLRLEQHNGESKDDTTLPGKIFVEATMQDAEALHSVEQAQGLMEEWDAESKELIRREHLIFYQSSSGNNTGKTIQELRVELEAGAERLPFSALSFVHATDFDPKVSKTTGELYIEEQFSATGLPRTSIHGSLNHFVESNTFSSDWSSKGVILVAPMDKVVEKNGEPYALIGHDTYFAVTPNEGLLLPTETIVISPGASKAIQTLSDGHEIRYKADGITVDDVHELVGMAQGYELNKIVRMLGIDIYKLPSEPQNLSYRLSHVTTHETGKTYQGTDIPEVATVVSDMLKEAIGEKMHSLVESQDPHLREIFTYLAKLVATRLALDIQQRDLMQPITNMAANFLSPELEKVFSAFSYKYSFTGTTHHSESPLGRVERILLGNDGKGLDDNVSEEMLSTIRQIFADEDIRKLPKAALHLLLRLNVLPTLDTPMRTFD